MIHLLLGVIYLAFISLGLPDGLLGSAWPTMHEDLDVNVSLAGVVSMIICCGTVISSLLSDRLTHRFGAGRVTAVSVCITALALLGFSVCREFWILCLLAIPYGLGAGSVDAALNNYVALHYASRHMSWLHCMWGVGASVGPYIMGHCLSSGFGWSAGYQTVGIIQVALSAALLFSLPLWKNSAVNEDSPASTPLSLPQIFRINGAKAVIITFFCYCGIESTIMLWASSYLVLFKGMAEEAAAFYASMFFLGMTVGRALNGFLTIRWNDRTLIRTGFAIIIFGIVVMLIPGGETPSLIGLLLIGLGCAPVYPCIIHSTPEIFGAERSQALIGVQMAGAYLGSMLLPPVFGIIANAIHVGLYPLFLMILSIIMIISYQTLLRQKQ